MSKQKLRQIALLVIAADFPILYLSASTPGGGATTVATLAVLAAAAVLAAIVY